MNKRFRGMFDLDKARLAIFAVAFAFCLAALWPHTAQGQNQEGVALYKKPLIDSATDDGNGRIRIAWSWEPIPEGHHAKPDSPTSICVYWVEGKLNNFGNKTCFTSELSPQEDLVIDTGMAEDTKSAVYDLLLQINYDHANFYCPPATMVTLKR